MNYESLFLKYKEPLLKGRYITNESIEPVLKKLNTNNQWHIEGYSVLKNPIYSYKIGKGKSNVFIWSQMHGNESTTTKALFDFLNLLNSKNETSIFLLNKYTFFCLPMVNPDGAKFYTRENANNIDLNRDAKNISQPESQILRNCFNRYNFDFCYNLHDQRTIFGVGNSGKPATISFLAPSYNEKREYNAIRIKAVQVINAMHTALQNSIPNQIGRFDDTYNSNCIGDTFQSLNVPTILIEAGHFPEDYNREITRKYIFISLLSGLIANYENDIVNNNINDYLSISQNNAVFYDFVYKNIKINYDTMEFITNFAIQFKEELHKNYVIFNAYIVKIGDIENYFGHFEYDALGAKYSDFDKNFPKINQKADFILDKNIKIVNGKLLI